MKGKLSTLFVLAFFAIVFSCKKDEGEEVRPSPVIDSFSPVEGPVGTTVTIEGHNFSNTSSSNTVKFNNIEALVVSATSSQLEVTVPVGATTGKISVTVAGKTGTSSNDFIIIQPPVISSFTPTSGTAGTAVTITGNNFSSTPANNVVKFNNTMATVSSATSTQLVVSVPAGAATGKISVTVNGLTAVSANDFTIAGSPTITSFTPTSGITGTSVTITGTNFSSTMGNNIVKFNNVSATVTSATVTELVATVPASATTGKISVTVGGLTAFSASDFTVTGSPTIASFTPTSGPTGTSVTITGTNFSSTAVNNTVKFNDVTATVSSATATQLVAVVPATATTGKITVTVGGLTATSLNDFIVVVPPTITSFTPSSGSPGASVTITGTNFSSTAGNNTVKFNNVTATVSSATATQLVVVVPATASTGKITVSVGGLTATSATDFTVVNPPTITSFTPTSGIVGTSVTITGTNFSTTVANNTVKFNNVTATVTSATATQLVTTVPAGASTGKITVTVGGNTATSANDFTVTAALSITSFTPTSGAIGTTVTITGTSFSTTPANNDVKFNNVAATVTSATATQLIVTVPATATTGKISITVGGTTVTSTNDFTVPAPTITSFSPTGGVAGQTVTITGTNFSPLTSSNVVKFNGVNATVTAATPTQLTVTVPASATTGKISVTLSSQVATSTNDFEIAKDIPRTGLVAFYPFTGNANDGSGNDLHGTASNTTLAQDRYGNANKAYSFNGTSSYISLGNPTALQIAGKITVAAWIRAADLAASNILSKYVSVGNICEGYYMGISNFAVPTVHGKYTLYMNERLGTNTNYYEGEFVTNQWVFVAATLDGSNISYYFGSHGSTLNEGMIASNNKLLINCAAAEVIVGANSAHTGLFFNGVIDDLVIYNRALSASELQQLFEQTISKY